MFKQLNSEEHNFLCNATEKFPLTDNMTMQVFSDYLEEHGYVNDAQLIRGWNWDELFCVDIIHGNDYCNLIIDLNFTPKDYSNCLNK